MHGGPFFFSFTGSLHFIQKQKISERERVYFFCYFYSNAMDFCANAGMHDFQLSFCEANVT